MESDRVMKEVISYGLLVDAFRLLWLIGSGVTSVNVFDGTGVDGRDASVKDMVG